jgi:endonuclease/exonuclease/phosphatase family metal-dependent hydrolase
MDRQDRRTSLGQPTLTVMSLNLAHGRSDGWHQALMRRRTLEDNLAQVARVIRRERPDVVALQEADGPSLWSGRFSHVEYLASLIGVAHYCHGHHVRLLKLTYGTALLSRHALRESASHTFAPSPPTLSKGMVIASIVWPGPEQRPIDLVSLHLDFSRRSVRQRQACEIIRRLKDRRRPLVLMGDFNCWWGGKERTLATLIGELDLRAYAPEADGMGTFPFHDRRLDWILISRELEFLEYRTLGDVVSDHRPVVACLRWATQNPGPAPPTLQQSE